ILALPVQEIRGENEAAAESKNDFGQENPQVCVCSVRFVQFRPFGHWDAPSHDESVHAPDENAATIGCDTSFNLVADTFCTDSIDFGAASRSSSGRFIVNAAIIRC